MQMSCWLICHSHDKQPETIFRKWHKACIDVYVQNQTVFKLVWWCSEEDCAIHCVQNRFYKTIAMFRTLTHA